MPRPAQRPGCAAGQSSQGACSQASLRSPGGCSHRTGEWPDEDLLRFGVPREWLADVRQASEKTLLALADHLPAEAAEALLKVATGGTPRVAPIVPALNPFEHPDAQRRFRVMTNIEELERAIEFPWEKWTIVSDTGIGISREKQDTIFDPCVQVHRNLTRPTEGTGLGLAISRDLARGMGGELCVRSAEGQGSTFTLALPRAVSTGGDDTGRNG